MNVIQIHDNVKMYRYSKNIYFTKLYLHIKLAIYITKYIKQS